MPRGRKKGKSRKADELAGKDSLADRLKRRRKAIESGDPTGGKAFKEKKKKRKNKKNKK